VRLFSFNLLKSGSEFRAGTHIVYERNWPIAVSVQLCEERNAGFAVHLHLYSHSVRNMSVHTVWYSSTC
jgi:hypothetical protein